MTTITSFAENYSGNSLHANKEFSTYKRSDRKYLREWGFEQAGLNRGDPFSLESHLRWIKEGHFVDNSEKDNFKVESLNLQISGKEKSQSDVTLDLEHIQKVIIGDKKHRIDQYSGTIEEKKKNLITGTIKSNFSLSRYLLYLSLTIVIGIYLIFFYASVINASFFRSMQQLVDSASSSDITLMLNSIFDVYGIFKPGPQLIFVYLGAFIFFGLGLLPHIFSRESSGIKWLKIVVAIVVCLVVDGMLAYKIDSNIHELKSMVGMGDAGWIWYKSINFYLVLVFGFCVYLLWGLIYEAAMGEASRKNIHAVTQQEIKGLKVKISKLEKEMQKDKKDIKDLQKQIDKLVLEIAELKKSLEISQLNPEQLLRSLENFYNGWLAYLLGLSESHEKKAICESVYTQFRQSLTAKMN